MKYHIFYINIIFRKSESNRTTACLSGVMVRRNVVTKTH